MNTKVLSFILALSFSFIGGNVRSAENLNSHKNPPRTFAAQQQRLVQAFQAGYINRAEFKFLKRELRQVAKFRELAFSDGFLNRHESRRLLQMQAEYERQFNQALQRNNRFHQRQHRRNHRW